MVWFLFLLISPFCVATGIRVQYRNLEELEVSCQPRDTCSNHTASTFLQRNCECDNQCRAFGDCCVDAPVPRMRHRHPRYKCFPISIFQGVYVIENCKTSWNLSNEVRRRCENHNDLSDPLMSRPTTDTHNNITYRNHYCAECNGAYRLNFRPWHIALTCNSLVAVDGLYHNITEDLVKENITRVESSWGVYHWNESVEDMVFYPCEISFKLPDDLQEHIRYCRPNVISTCAADWKRKRLRCYCAEYMAVIYINDQAYRNPHCALCNRASIENRICYLPQLSRKTPSMSFTLLLDVNQKDGDKVGEVNPCSSGEKYDPFAKKCRTLVCALPRHSFKNDRCVPD